MHTAVISRAITSCVRLGRAPQSAALPLPAPGARGLVLHVDVQFRSYRARLCGGAKRGLLASAGMHARIEIPTEENAFYIHDKFLINDTK